MHPISHYVQNAIRHVFDTNAKKKEVPPMSAYTIHLLECDFCKEILTHSEEFILHTDSSLDIEGWTYREMNGEYGLCCPKCGVRSEEKNK